MQGKSLKEARRLFRSRRFPEVIRALEPEVFRYRENAAFFTLLGLSCLHTGDFGGAQSYLTRAKQLKDDATVLLGLAAIALKKGQNEEALRLWLEVMDQAPRNRTAQRGMNLLRKSAGSQAFQEFLDAGRIKTLFPGLPPRIRWPVLVIPVLAILAVGLGAILWTRTGRSQEPTRPGVASVDIPPTVTRLAEEGSGSTIRLSEKEVFATFQKAKKLLLEYRDNPAVLEINRLLLSNATAPVKERALVLKGFIRPSDFASLKESFSYREVNGNPPLYDGSSVAWKGKVANLRTSKESILFDFLVGYQEQKELEGIVPMTLTFPTILENGMPLEVLGTVSSTSGKLGVIVTSLHRLANP
jgi:hypothetical protein